MTIAAQREVVYVFGIVQVNIFVSHAGTISFFVCGGVKPVLLKLVSCYIKKTYGSDSWLSIPRPFDLEPTCNTPQFSDVYPVYLSIIDTIITRYYPQNCLHITLRTELFLCVLFIQLLFSSFLSFFSFLFKIIFSNTIFQEQHQNSESFDPGQARRFITPDLGPNFL